MQLIDNDVVAAARTWTARLNSADRRLAVLAALILCLGATPISPGQQLSLGQAGGGRAAGPDTALEASTGLSSRTDRAGSRSRARTAPGSPSAAGSAPAASPPPSAGSASSSDLAPSSGSSPAAETASPVPPASPPAASSAPASPPADPPPVAGLNQRQMNHARTIVLVGQQLDMPQRAYVVAIATAMQESNLRNLANPALPVSLSIPNDGSGVDHDSVGLFQQRPASGWGTVQELMDPATSARKFYQALSRVPGWDTLPVTVAAQSVQRSAFPDAYAKHQPRAETIVDALTN